jgi:hypothetical protein
MSILKAVRVLVRNLFVNRSILIAENLALRQQLAIQQRTIRRPKYLIRDRDGIYGKDFFRRVQAMSIKEVIISMKRLRNSLGLHSSDRRTSS